MKKLFAGSLFAALFAVAFCQPGHAQTVTTAPSGYNSLSGTLSLATIGNTYILPISNGWATVTVNTTGIASSGGTVVVDESADAGQTTWTNINFHLFNGNVASSFANADAANNFIGVSGYGYIRFRVTGAGTGSATINTTSSSAPSAIALSGGNFSLGSVTVTSGSTNIAGNASAPTHVSGSTSATAGVSSTLVAAAGVTKGIQIDNTCSTAVWVSPSLAVGTALTAANSFTIPANTLWSSPDWFPISGAWTIASATAVACTYTADYK